MEGSKKNSGEGGKTPWVGLLESAAKQVLGVLLTAGGLIGFVAFAGAVIVWTRFSAANVPPDQAVNAVPKEELVAIGASLLLIFGFFGILAVITMYLVDRGGRVTTGMTRALLLLLTIEGVTAIGLAGGVGSKRTTVAAELFLLSMGVLLWSTFSARFTEQDVENLTQRTDNERDSVRKDHTFRTAGETDPIDRWTYLVVLAIAFDLAVCAGLIALEMTGSTMSAWMVGLPVLAIALALAILFLYVSFARDPAGIHEALANADVDALEEEEVAEELRTAQPAQFPCLPPPLPSEEDEGAPKPPRLDLKLAGVCLVVAIFLIATIGPSIILGKAWIAVSLGSAAVLSAGLWRIGYLAAPSFIWYGLAVFVSVPLFGTLTAMARNIEDPQVQPMALIRNTDGPDEAIQGIYVTEADSRVYFATAETEGCTNELLPHSGRLLWVPKSEVVAMTVGPSQDVKEAANTALEMSYALTPGLGLPNRNGPSLVSGNGGEGDPSAELDKRLGSVGAAVHPNFGSGLSLVPPEASPGGTVTLRVSLPNGENGVNGFGSTREGRTLRVGGVPAPIIRETVKSASEAEFVKTKGGKVLALDKEGVYGRGKDGGFYLVKHLGNYFGRRFLKLSEASGAEVKGELHRPDGSSYLELQSRHDQVAGGKAMFLEGQGVILKSGEEPILPYLLRQDWHEDHIRFRVPDNANSGVVSVECRQLAGEPVLDVARPPVARIAVRMQAGSKSVSFDSSGSSDDGSVLSRRWTIEGHARGGSPRLSLDLAPRLRPYSVRLTVTGEDHQSDSAQLRLARLPASLFGFDKEVPEDGQTIERIGDSLAKTAREERPTAVELDGHTDEVGSAAYNLGLSLRRAEAVRKELLPAAPAGSEPGVASSVPVALRAFGESCPLDRHHPRSRIDRRVEVFLLGQGATVAPRPGCRVGREETSRWQLPPPP